MKLAINKYKYEKVLDTSSEVEIPEVPEYHFQTGIRRSIAIIPEWTTWQKENFNKPEQVHTLVFICIYGNFENKVEITRCSVENLRDYLTSTINKTDSSIVNFFLNERDEYTTRTKEQFMADYNNAITKFTDNINLLS